MGVINKLQELEGKVGEMITDNVSVVTEYLRTGDVLDIRGENPYRAASVIKVPISIALCEGVENNRLSLDDELVLTEENKVEGKGRVDRSKIGEKFKVEDLVYYMLTQSDNSATNTLIDYIGEKEVNHTMEKHGYRNTHLGRKMQYTGDGESITTPREMTELFEALYRETILPGKYCRFLLNILKQSEFKNRIPRKLPKEIEIAHKGGTLSKEKWGYSVVHDVGIIYLPYRNYILSVFTQDMSLDEGSGLIADISKAVYSCFASRYPGL